MTANQSTHTMADMKMLLETLRYSDQQNCSEAFSATAALLSQSKQAQDCFQSAGGLDLVFSITKNCNQEDTKKSAIFTLALAAENNSKIQAALTDDKVFKFIKSTLGCSKSVVIQTTASFLVISLCSRNADGQVMARDSRCLHKLCDLFKECLPSSTATNNQSSQQWFDNIDCKSVELWTTVCSALCSVLVNPQNEENQRLCCILFPTATRVLRGCGNMDLIHPVVSLLGACVMSNRDCQTRLRIVGGIRAMVEVLKGYMSRGTDQEYSALDMNTIGHLASNLGPTYAEHDVNQIDVGELGLVELILKCLSINCHHGSKLSRFRMQCLIALSGAVDSCEKNQQIFRDCDGTSILVELLTEAKDPDFTKLATFVLHCCLKKQDGNDGDASEDDVLMEAAAEQAKRLRTGELSNVQKTQGKPRPRLTPEGTTQKQPPTTAVSAFPPTSADAGDAHLMKVIQRQQEVVNRLENKITELELQTKQGCSGAEPTECAQSLLDKDSVTCLRDNVGRQGLRDGESLHDAQRRDKPPRARSMITEFQDERKNKEQVVMPDRQVSERSTNTRGGAKGASTRPEDGGERMCAAGAMPQILRNASDSRPAGVKGAFRISQDNGYSVKGVEDKEERSGMEGTDRQWNLMAKDLAELQNKSSLHAQEINNRQNSYRAGLQDAVKRSLESHFIRPEMGTIYRLSENSTQLTNDFRGRSISNMDVQDTKKSAHEPVNTQMRVRESGHKNYEQDHDGDELGTAMAESQESVSGTFSFENDADDASRRREEACASFNKQALPLSNTSSLENVHGSVAECSHGNRVQRVRGNKVQTYNGNHVECFYGNNAESFHGNQGVAGVQCWNSPGLRSVSTQSEFDYDSDDYSDYDDYDDDFDDDGHHSGYEARSDGPSDCVECSCSEDEEVIMITGHTLHKLSS